MDKNPAVKYIGIDEDRAGQRLDNFLIYMLKGVPKSLVYKIIRKGEVRVNKKRAKAHVKLHKNDIVRIPPIRVAAKKEATQLNLKFAQTLERSILFENEKLLVVNKPSGVAVHGGSGIHLGLIESFRKLRPEEHFMELVHRIDRDTSGCLLIAKKRSMLRYLHEEIRQGRVHKVYQAWVIGVWPANKKIVSLPLQKNILQSGERMVVVSEDGKPSTTRFNVLKSFSNCTLMKIILETGRTHQIRVHCQSEGHPVVGDSKYGDDAFNKEARKKGMNRLMLHAWQLRFTLPNGEAVEFIAPPPESFDL